jgi:hypothetical protein
VEIFVDDGIDGDGLVVWQIEGDVVDDDLFVYCECRVEGLPEDTGVVGLGGLDGVLLGFLLS